MNARTNIDASIRQRIAELEAIVSSADLASLEWVDAVELLRMLDECVRFATVPSEADRIGEIVFDLGD